ncbi:MAG: ATP-binding cassette domain-containing protein [Chthoniobacterales bacterium]|nr:ATP-binding cassette domain-containing protein [Chthoniobacterales bacterium]
MTAPPLRCRNLHCRRPLWRQGASAVRGISMEFDPGRFHAITGTDGCGHNLLLHLLGLLEQPDLGEVLVGDIVATSLEDTARDGLRQENFGFLFPACALLPSLTVLENIAFPVLKTGGLSEADQAEHTLFALQFCGLEDDAQSVTGTLTPERQSLVSFARAIVHRPRVIIAESPTEAETLVALGRRAVDDLGLTVVWGTQTGGQAAAAADRVLSMEDGRLVS